MKLQISNILDMRNLKIMIGQGFISARKHATAPYTIYNYTHKCQFDREWNKETRQCRGLILNQYMEVIARPFPKFFNYEEYAEGELALPMAPCEVYEKMDGSLGILYFIGHTPYISTRGSFESPQAIKATEILHTRYDHVTFRKDITYLFEIIYPANRIVIDYGAQEDLVLLAMIDNESGKDVELEDIGMPIVKRYDSTSDFDKLAEQDVENREGYVLKFNNGFRMKVKFAEYKRLHRLISHMSPKHIWEMLRDNVSINDTIGKVSDDYRAWITGEADKILNNFDEIERACSKEFKVLEDRKTTALYFTGECTYPAVLFSMLDNKDFQAVIWKLVKPNHHKVFKEIV